MGKGLQFTICGAGGIRTLVQTSSKNAFYMLSDRLIVGVELAGHQPIQPLVLLNLPRLQNKA